MSAKLQRLILLAVAFAAGGGTAWSQARLTGTVRDSSGAVVAGAQVVARNVSTGLTTAAQTSNGFKKLISDSPERLRFSVPAGSCSVGFVVFPARVERGDPRGADAHPGAPGGGGGRSAVDFGWQPGAAGVMRLVS